MIAVFGGTFDPVHEGHLQLARRVLIRYSPRRLYLVPAGRNPLKTSAPLAPAENRFEMLRLAVAEAGEPRLEALDWEARSAGPSYTIHTVERLLETEKEPLALVMGNEVFAGLPRWKEARKLALLVDFIVVVREAEAGFEPAAVLKALGIDDQFQENETRIRYSGATRWVDRMPMQPIPVSATELRQRLASGSPAPQGIQRSVWQYIKEKGLYTVTKKEG